MGDYTFIIDGTPYAVKVARTVWTYTKFERIVRDGEEVFTAKLDKGSYSKDEGIVVSGKVISNNALGTDITLKMADADGTPIVVDQNKVDKDGNYQFEFKVPEDIVSGTYKLTLKANDPFNKLKVLELKIN